MARPSSNRSTYAKAPRFGSASRTKKNDTPTWRRFIDERLRDAFGLCLALSGAFIALSIVSYHPGDPSLNTFGAATDSVANAGGVYGAYVADALFQFVGLGALALAAMMGVRGVMVLRRNPARLPVYVRLPALVLGMVCIAAAFGKLGMGQGMLTYGGSIGHAMVGGLTNMLAGFIGGAAGATAIIACALLGTGLTALSFGASLDAWRTGLGFTGQWTVAFSSSIANAAHAFSGWVNRGRHDDDDELAPVARSPRARRAPPVDSDDMDDEALIEQDEEEEENYKPRAEIAIVRPGAAPKEEKKREKPAKAAKQASLGLNTEGEWVFPPIDFLQEEPDLPHDDELDERALTRNAELLQKVLLDFNVTGEILKIHPGPVVTLYEFEPAPGIRSSRIIGLADDIARSMSAISVRAAVVPGRNVIGIEIPNKKRRTVYMHSMVTSPAYRNSNAKLPVILGKDIGGEPVIADLATMPHLLVAGTTGSGKSVGVNTMLLSLLYKFTPEKCRFIMIDPKMLELSIYDDIPHLLTPVVTEPGKAVVALKWAVHEMEERYRLLSKLSVRNIDGYNARIREALAKGDVLSRKVQTGFDPDTGKPIFEEQPIEPVELPYIVIVVDEFADLMLVAGKDVEGAIQRLAQMARAAGIHLIMATQRPSVDVITGVIKANFPTRISFQVTSKIDSRTILGEGGAEQLLGRGDMLYMATGGRIQRVHGPFVADSEVEEVVRHIKAQAEPQYLEDVTVGGDDGENGDMFGEMGGGGGDELYDRAVALVAREGKASTSFIQRHLQIGYNRAATLIEKMEKQGVVSPANHVGKREVLIGSR